MRLTTSFLLASLLALGAAACRNVVAPGTNDGAAGTNTDAQSFLKEANDTMLRLSNEANQAGWVQNTYITPDSEAMAARANTAYMTAVTDYAKRAAGFDTAAVPAESARQLTVLKNALTMAAPADPKEAS